MFDVNNQFSSEASLSDSTPGNLMPCMNSREAPPPVEMNVTSLVAPLLMTKLAVSPPPMIEVAPALVLATTLFNRPSLPFLKLGNSKTPIGPFQKIELAL
jgi:hypothetical protein